MLIIASADILTDEALRNDDSSVNVSLYLCVMSFWLMRIVQLI